MVPILSFKLLPNRDSYGVGTSLVRESSFGGKILGTSCLLMLFPSRFTLPRKVKHSVQILMTWDNWGRSSLLEMSLLFLRFIWLFVTSQIANSTLRNALGLFSLSGLYDPEHSLVLTKSIYYIFFKRSQNSSGVFYMFSFWFWSFQKY